MSDPEDNLIPVRPENVIWELHFSAPHMSMVIETVSDGEFQVVVLDHDMAVFLRALPLQPSVAAAKEKILHMLIDTVHLTIDETTPHKCEESGDG